MMKKILCVLLLFSVSTIGVYAQKQDKTSSQERRQPPIFPGDLIICPDGQTLVQYFHDQDSDGIGGLRFNKLCSPPPTSPAGYEYVTINGDCDDTDPTVGLGPYVYYEDTDHDGFGDPNVSQAFCTPPGNSMGYVLDNSDQCPTVYGQENGCPVGGTHEDMNWIISKAYDIQGGLLSSSKGYFDELGKSIQAQSVDIKTGKTWASSTVYDTHGRPALQSLSAPVAIQTGSFLYQPDFIKKSNGQTYTNADFETNEENPESIGNQEHSLGWYYSENNSSERYQDVTDYPFSRTIYSRLNPGAALKTIGGNKVSINGQPEQWINGFTYTVPAAQEMYYVFGKGYFGEEGVIEDNEVVITKFYKTVSIDIHGVESVVFTDGEGKTLAAARSGGNTKYEVVSTIGEQGFVDVHIPDGILNSDIQLIGNTNNYKIFDLRTEQIVNSSTMTGGNFYRIEYLGTTENSQSFINVSGQITTSPTAKGIRYKVNYYDYTLNYYDKAGRLLETTQPIGFDESSFDLAAEFPNHQMKSTYTYNAQNQLLETTSPDEGRANFVYREDGQIRLSQNTKQATAGEFSYTNYDDKARPIESGVYNGPLSFSESAQKSVTLIDQVGIQQQGNQITKVPRNAWDSGMASTKVISGNGYIQWQFPSSDISAMVGLSAVNANYNYATIQYGLKVIDGQVYVFESNVQKAALGSFQANDVFRIEKVNNTLYYRKNNVNYNYQSYASVDLLADVAIYSSDGKISNFGMRGTIVTPNNIDPFKYKPNITVSGNTITKTGGADNSWNGGFHTSEFISGDGAVSWNVTDTNKLIMVGLSSNTALSSVNYVYMNYAIYMYNGVTYIYEFGRNVGSFGAYAANDNFKVERMGSQIRYLKNGSVFYTSTIPSFNEDLMGYASFRNLNGSISNFSVTGGDHTYKDLYRVKTAGRTIEKVSAYSWNAGFASTETITGDGYVTFTAPQNTKTLMLGLSETNANYSYNTIGFAIYLANRRVYVYESGSYKGQKSTYEPGDTFKVERTGAGTIRYYKNDVVVYTSEATSTAPLLIDASFNSPETSIENLEFYDLVNSSNVVMSTSNLDTQYCKERHITIYDAPEFEDMHDLYNALQEEDIPSSHYSKQNFVAGNVAKTYTKNPSTTTTWYSYDIYGRVVWLVQKIDGLGTKTIDYEYHPVTGTVTKVLYQKHKPIENFVHWYNYNTIGQLTEVRTSENNTNFLSHARYIYTETGALKRTVLGNNIQGIDYVYNLAGQLKAINHPSLAGYLDPGGDSNDAFGMHIDYYSGDYARTNAPTPIASSPSGENRYDGNIKATRWTTRGLDPNPAGEHNAYTYTYNKNNWLSEATYGTSNETHIITPSPNNSYRVSNLTYDANGNLLSLNRNKKQGAMDRFSYHYNGQTNQLNHVDDTVPVSSDTDDLNSQNQDNYIYNSIGQLVKEQQDSHEIEYVYNASGLVTQIKKDGTAFFNIYYNDKGHRVRKEVTYNQGASWDETYYVRDASGSVMAIYEGSYGTSTLAPRLKEYPIYGVSRLGVYNKSSNKTRYELTDHLGNVRAVITPGGSTSSYTDYYPGGMAMPNRNVEGGYRYNYQGQELDQETGKVAFELRLYDPRINRWFTTDPYGQYHSPYVGMGNDWVNGIDPDGGWKTKWGRFWGWVGNGFKGEFYNSDVATGKGKYGLAFDYGGGDGPGELTGTFMAVSGADLDSWNMNQEWGNWRFTESGQGFEVAMMRQKQHNFFGSIENSLNNSDSALSSVGSMGYNMVDDVYSFGTHFSLLSPNGPRHLNGNGIVRGSSEGIDTGINGMLTIATFGRLKKPTMNMGQFNAKYKGVLTRTIKSSKIKGIILKNMNRLNKYWGRQVIAPNIKTVKGVSESIFGVE